MKKLKAFVTTYEWWLLSIAITGTFFLSMWAYHLAFTVSGEQATIADLVYYSFQLFTLKFVHPKGHVPLLLDVMRFLAPFLAGLAGLKALLLIARAQVRLLKAKTYKGHIVICGMNDKSMRLAYDLLRQGEKVIVIGPGDRNAQADRLIDGGGVALAGNPDDRYVLERSRVQHANHLICCDEDDSKNIATAFLAYHLVKDEGTQQRFTSHVHVSDMRSLDRLEDLDAFIDNERRDHELRPTHENDIITFNIFARAARQILQAFPPDAFLPVRVPAEPPLHIAICGFGLLGQGLLMQCALMGHYLNSKKTCVTVFAIPADERLFNKTVAHHQLDQVIIPRFVPLIDGELDQQSLELAEKEEAISTVFAALDDDDDAFRIVHGLHSLVTRRQQQVIVAMNKPDGILNLLPGTIGGKDSPVRKFDVVAETCTGDAIIGETVDRLARVIHKDYLELRRRRGEFDPRKPTHRQWNRLNDDVKNHNRSQADHVWVKLRAASCTVRPIADAVSPIDWGSHPELVEQLAIIEHNRWCAYMLTNGWRRGEKRDDTMRLHPDLVPYASLPESVKQYDKDTVMNIPRLLNQLGLTAVTSTHAASLQS